MGQARKKTWKKPWSKLVHHRATRCSDEKSPAQPIPMQPVPAARTVVCQLFEFTKNNILRDGGMSGGLVPCGKLVGRRAGKQRNNILHANFAFYCSGSGFPELGESDPGPNNEDKPTRFLWQETKLWQFHSDAWGLLRPKVCVHVCPKSVWLLSLLASGQTKNRTTSNCTLRACVRKAFLLYALRAIRTILSSMCSFWAALYWGDLCSFGLCYQKSGNFKMRTTSRCLFQRAM